jgi:hypothetical protein
VAGAPISSAWHPLTSILRLVVLNLVETVDEFDPPLGQRLLGYVVKLGVQCRADKLERILPHGHGNSSPPTFVIQGLVRTTEFLSATFQT